MQIIDSVRPSIRVGGSSRCFIFEVREQHFNQFYLNLKTDTCVKHIHCLILSKLGFLFFWHNSELLGTLLDRFFFPAVWFISFKIFTRFDNSLLIPQFSFLIIKPDDQSCRCFLASSWCFLARPSSSVCFSNP